MSVSGPIVRKSCTSGAALAANIPVRSTTEDPLNQGLVVVPAIAITSVIIGVTLEDSTAAGQGASIAIAGSVILMRCGSGGVTKDSLVGLDSTDFTKIAMLTLNAAGTVNRQIFGTAVRTGAPNDLIPIIFDPFMASV